MKKYLFLATILSQAISWAADSTIIAARKQAILNAFNARPDLLIEPLKLEDVQLGEHDGRVVVNKKAKFTYYVHINGENTAQAKLTLIPMSTSRFTPTYYQTDEWWDAHKAEIDEAKRTGKPQPKQDMNEVAAWLKDMKLSTNPDVLEVDPVTAQVRRTSLSKYLLNIYLERFTENGKVVLYRGAERPNELESWKAKQAPKGARYWTPTANYAWRYARKNREFIQLMNEYETPLFRFEIPVADFKAMVDREWPRLTLGVELTKNSHQIFDRSMYFGDHFYGSMPYMGVGFMGLEFELRGNRQGLIDMTKYYVRPATIADMAKDRQKVIELTLRRWEQQLVTNKSSHLSKLENRMETLQAEKRLLLAVQSGLSYVDMDKDFQTVSRNTGEITYIDGFHFSNWIQEQIKSMKVKTCEGFF